MEELAPFRWVRRRPSVRCMLLLAVLVLMVSLASSGALGASPTQEILRRLGTSVEARIVTLSTADLPKTAFEIDMVVGVASYINANMIFVEILNDDGYVNYPSKVWPHREGDTDRLKMLIDRAHAKGMQVVPWIKTFFAAAHSQLGPVLEQHPDWAAVGSDGNIFTSYGLAWFNAAHPDARAFIQRAILELVTDYDIDGLQLDYIRYPNTYPTHIPTVYGYDDYSRQTYKQATGIDPIELRTPTFQQLAGPGVTLQSLPPDWQSWTVWRENQVTSFLDELTQQIRAIRPDFPLFFGVIPALWSGTTYPHARFLLNQHWTAWVEAGYVDGLTPPSYTDEDAVLIREVTNVRNLALESQVYGPVTIYPSLMVYPEPNILVRQIELLREMEIPGARLFTYGRMGLPHLQALAQGPFSEPALIPHDKPFRSALRLTEELDAALHDLSSTEDSLSADVLNELRVALRPLRESLAAVAARYPDAYHRHHVVRQTGITAVEAEELRQMGVDASDQAASILASDVDDAIQKGVMKSLRYVQQLIEYGIMIEAR